jgi:hypothetical protein
MNKKQRYAAIAAGVLASAALGTTAQAQSSDALIDKLVDKGILTLKEANDLRDEADKDFTRALSSKNGMPEWVTAVKFNGDLRLRNDQVRLSDVAGSDRNRFRYRLRFGWTATLADNWEVGIGLTSTELPGELGSDPISNNQSFKDNAGKKAVGFDKVYVRWTPINSAEWLVSTTLGKMDNPIVFPSTILFDKDYTPEGFAQEATYRFTPDQAVKFTGFGFVLDEAGASAKDPYLLGAQLRYDASWTPAIQTSFGAAVLSILNPETLTTASVPDIASGNTRNAAGALVNPYTSVYVDANVTYNFEKFPGYMGPFPVTLSADYLRNVALSANNDGYSLGFTLGKSGKKGLWDINYRYTVLNSDAWYEEFVESDFGANYKALSANTSATGYRSGTNLRGHWLKGTYSFYDSLSFSVAYFMTDVINEPAVPGGYDSGAGRLFIEAVWKF